MSTYKQIFYHIIFGTRNRETTLAEEHCTELYKYIWGVIEEKHCKLYRINGMEDHIHIFSDLHPSVSLADYIKDIKLTSGSWIKDCGLFPGSMAGRMVMVHSPTASKKNKSLLIM